MYPVILPFNTAFEVSNEQSYHAIDNKPAECANVSKGPICTLRHFSQVIKQLLSDVVSLNFCA